MARCIALYNLAPHSKKALKPSDICVFEWEKKQTAKTLSKQEKEDAIRQAAQLAKAWKNTATTPLLIK